MESLIEKPEYASVLIEKKTKLYPLPISSAQIYTKRGARLRVAELLRRASPQ